MRSRNVGYMIFTPEKASYPPLAAFREWLFNSVESKAVHGRAPSESSLA